MNEFLEEKFSYLAMMTSIIYCMLGFVRECKLNCVKLQ